MTIVIKSDNYSFHSRKLTGFSFHFIDYLFIIYLYTDGKYSHLTKQYISTSHVQIILFKGPSSFTASGPLSNLS